MQYVTCMAAICIVLAGQHAPESLIFVVRKRKIMPGDLLEAQEFAQSKAQAQKRGRTGVVFADVAGCDHTLNELREVVAVCKQHLLCSDCPQNRCMCLLSLHHSMAHC